MACSRQPGPAMSIRLIERHLTGVKLTQADWHALRASAEDFMGEPLSQSSADDVNKIAAAVSLTHALGVPRDEAKAFITDFTESDTTLGTCQTLQHLAKRGIPIEIITRKRRNRGREAEASVRKVGQSINTQECVISRDLGSSGVIIDGQSHRLPLFRVTAQGRLVGVAVSRSEAKELATGFEANPRW